MKTNSIISIPFTVCLISSLMLNGSLLAQGNTDKLRSGPMVGYSNMREVMLWVQTSIPAEVYVSYSLASDAKEVFKTATYHTAAEEAYTAHLLADQVQPGMTYHYTLYIDGEEVPRPYDLTFETPALWQYRTDPPDIKIALGSCAKINEETYDRPGTPYGGEYEIFEAIHREKPDMMLWLGDNLYFEPADWGSRTGIIHRYTHTRSLRQMQALLASTANYAIWDDHDYGPNNSDRSYINRETALEAFKLFWANPNYGVFNESGITSAFSWSDADFFLLDNRYFRTPNDREVRVSQTILGEHQVEWIIDALVTSKATFKFVVIGGQVINNTENFETYINLAPEERKYLLDAIVQEKIENVIFLTGDRHHSELSLYEKDGIKIYDFTCSPLTSGPHDASDEPNSYRIPGSQIGIRNFGTIDISGEKKDRKLILKLFDSKGEELWKHEIEAE